MIKFKQIRVPVIECIEIDGVKTALRKFKPIQILVGENGSTEAEIMETFEQIAELRTEQCLRECECDYVIGDPFVIGRATTTYEQNVFYHSILDECVSVILMIEGAIPPNINLYKLSANQETEGKFGNLSVAKQAPGGGYAMCGDAVFVWTQKTFYPIPVEAGRERYIRVSLKPGLTYTLYDSGERKK